MTIKEKIAMLEKVDSIIDSLKWDLQFTRENPDDPNSAILDHDRNKAILTIIAHLEKLV